jgi:hypothetical protein
MKVEVKYDKYQPFILDNLKWGKVAENIYYARFKLKEHKYVHYHHHYEYLDNKRYFVLTCSPMIYTDDFKLLKEINLDEYYLHKDYWQASLAFEYPEEVLSFDSFSINALKWEYELWFINVDQEKFFSEYDNMPIVKVTIGKKD